MKKKAKWDFPIQKKPIAKKARVHVEFRADSKAPDYIKRARDFAYEHSTVRNHEAFVLGTLLGYLRQRDAIIAKMKSRIARR